MLTLAQTSRRRKLEEPAGAERRRGLRIQQTRPIKVYDPTISRYYGGQTQDVSSTGLRLELPASASVRPGRLLSIHVGLNDKGEALANRRQMIPVRVMWVDRSDNGSSRTLSMGIEFLASIAAELDAA
jgi:hypothetical protein